MKYLLLIPAILMILSCGESNHQNHEAQEVASVDPADSLRKEVMAAHDVAMPKIGKLQGYQKLLTQKIDSLTALGGQQVLIAQFDSLRMELAAAEKGMNDWMDGFDYDPEMSADSVLIYFADQKVKAEKMRDDILTALQKATTLLAE